MIRKKTNPERIVQMVIHYRTESIHDDFPFLLEKYAIEFDEQSIWDRPFAEILTKVLHSKAQRLNRSVVCPTSRLTPVARRVDGAIDAQ
jgi:hypothetical protein